MALSINDIIDRAPAGGTVTLPPGEFEGPVYIRKPLHIIGSSTTLWSQRGNTLVISSEDVTLQDITVELTDGRMNDNAIFAGFPPEIKNVTVYGAVRGFGAEDIRFEMPRMLELGRFAAEKTNTYVLRITTPVAADIRCNASGVTFSPSHLEAGDNEVTITVSNFNAAYHLFAEVELRSLFTRKLFLTGKPCADTEPVTNWRLTSGDFNAPHDSTLLSMMDGDRIAVEPQELPLLQIRKMQRISLPAYVGSRCDISFHSKDNGGLEIDPYVFQLDSTGKAPDIGCLVFFGNSTSPDGSVTHHSEDNHITIDFNRISPSVERIVIVYSVYGGDERLNFSLVKYPELKISSCGRDRISYNMYNLGNAPTVIAAELYRYENEWKISATGWGYRQGVADLCLKYGINVIN